jgi:hypothetical protein
MFRRWGQCQPAARLTTYSGIYPWCQTNGRTDRLERKTPQPLSNFMVKNAMASVVASTRAPVVPGPQTLPPNDILVFLPRASHVQ